ncbi:MAG: signal peptidase II [Planctomycetes bacterium]|jgi:signal peptidase II|nr:signal peptidase II [Planctomycetota bacterium]
MGKKGRAEGGATPGPAPAGTAPAPGSAPAVLGPWRDRLLFLAVAVVGAAADVLSKHAVFSLLGTRIVTHEGRTFALAEREVPLLGETLKFQAAMNQGAVFGIFQGKWLFLVVFGLIAVGIIAWVLFKSRQAGPVLVSGLGFVCAGALGNLWDRLLFTAVRDFIAFSSPLLEPFIQGGRWPNFNLADAWIVVGIPLILIGDTLNARRAKAAEKGGNSS